LISHTEPCLEGREGGGTPRLGGSGPDINPSTHPTVLNIVDRNYVRLIEHDSTFPLIHHLWGFALSKEIEKNVCVLFGVAGSHFSIWHMVGAADNVTWDRKFGLPVRNTSHLYIKFKVGTFY